MIVGIILVGSLTGAVSALMALILGQSIWMALLLYSAVGVLSVLAGAGSLVLRGAPEERAEPGEVYLLSGPQRG